jgi:hypothetical protein
MQAGRRMPTRRAAAPRPRRAPRLSRGAAHARPTPRQLGEVFGSGVQTYFQLLRWLCFATTASACSVYTINCAIALAASADPRLSDPTGIQRVSRVTLWPLQLLQDGEGRPSVSFGPGAAASRADKRAALLAMSLLDLGAVIALLAVLVAFRARVRRAEEAANVATITVDDYSLVLHGLPRVPLERQELSAYLQEAVPALRGHVAEVVVGRAYGEFLEPLYEAEEAETEVATLDATAAATGKPAPARRRARLLARAAAARKALGGVRERGLVAVCAFVTFDSVAARDAAAAAFPGGLLRAACPALAPAHVPRFRARHVLRGAPAGDPTGVLWENVHVTAAQRHARQLLAGLCAFALVLVTTSLVVGAKTYEKNLPPYLECATATSEGGNLPCGALFDLAATASDDDPRRRLVKQLGREETAATCDAFISATSLFVRDLAPLAPVTPATDPGPEPRALACGAAACYGCYCKTAVSSYWQWRADAHGLKRYCDDVWGRQSASWALKGVSMISVIGVNLAFLIVMPKFTRLQKLPTRGEHDAANVRKIFGATFFNAFVVTLAVYANIAQLKAFPLVFKGAYTDFMPAWFQAIGSALFVTLCTQCVQPPLQSALVAVMHARGVRARVPAQRTQRQLDALLAGPTWQLSYRTAKLLSTIWLALMLCGGIPGAGFLLPFGLWLSYFADKHFLCHTSRTPPRHPDDMVKTMRHSLVWAVWLHTALTAWMFGSPALPAFTTGGGSHGSHSTKLDGRNAYAARATNSREQFDVAERLQRWPALVQAVAFFVLTVWLFLIKPYRRPLSRALRALLPHRALPAPRASAPDVATQMSYREARRCGRLLGLGSYHILKNPAYADAIRPLFEAGDADADADADGVELPPA